MKTLREYQAMPGKPGTSASPMPGKPDTKSASPAQPSTPQSGQGRPVTWEELASLRKTLDQVWKHLGVDISFSHHFFDRVNDPRNKRQITIPELTKLFSDTYKKHGTNISGKVKPGTDNEFQAVLTDLSTKVNLPFVLKWDSKKRELVLLAMTVMRKDNFYTPDQKLTVQHYEPHGAFMSEKTKTTKTYSELKEWLGFDTPEVAPIATPQAVDDVDNAAFAVEDPYNLDKLNAFCAGIANHQYINPYYPLNKLWSKLSIIGLNFDLKALMLQGNHGVVSTPLTQYGGRFGVLGGAEYVSKDDGISNRVPGGLSLVVHFQKTGGAYTLTATIERSGGPLGFGEEAVTEATEPFCSGVNEKKHPFHKIATDHGFEYETSHPDSVGGHIHTYIHPEHGPALALGSHQGKAAWSFNRTAPGTTATGLKAVLKKK